MAHIQSMLRSRSLAVLFLGVVIVDGFLLRFWLTRSFWAFPNAEAGSVARALARGKGFADAFYAGQGPTAHLMPIAPAVSAGTYYLFGDGVSGEIVRRLMSYTTTALCYFLAALCCRLGGARTWSLLVGLGVLFLVPVYGFTEMIRWQAWDGGFAMAIALATVAYLMLQERGLARKQGGLQGLLPAATFITNPLMGVSAGAATFAAIFRHKSGYQRWRAVLLCFGCACLVTAPWAARNYAVFGTFIPTRDNLGLELSVANYPGAVGSPDEERAVHTRMQQVHPYENPLVQQRMAAAGGEQEYYRGLGNSAFEWMKSHPLLVTEIWAKHLWQSLFPQPYMFRLTHVHSWLVIRALWCALVTILGLVSLVVAVKQGDRDFRYLAVLLFTLLLLGLPFRPVLRYCWPFYPVFGCLAADLLGRLWQSPRQTTARARGSYATEVQIPADS